MDTARGPGRATWVLAGSLLAAALALPAESGNLGQLPAGQVPLQHPLGPQPLRDPHTVPGAGLERTAQHLHGSYENRGQRAAVKVTTKSRGRQETRQMMEMKWTSEDLPLGIWPSVENSHVTTPEEAPFGMKFSKEIEVFNPPLASAASRGPWIHSIFAFTHSWPRKTLFKRDSAVTHRLYGDISRDSQGTSENGVIFQKCAVVSVQSEWPSVHVRLFVNNTRTPTAANLSDLLLLDNITGLTVRESAGNQTSRGFQAFRKKFLQVGDSFLVSYTASLEARDVGSGDILLLPAQLSFQSSSPNRTQLKAPFTITAEEKITVLPNHGLHAAGFCVAFILSLVLTWAVLFFMVRYQCVKGSSLTRHQVQHHENKLEHSQFTSADGVNEDLALNDQMIDILSSEDPRSMLQALEELEIATLNRADSDLEACRTQISKDIIALLLKNLTSSGQLSPQVERRMGVVFKKQFLLLEKEIQEEYDRKMVALTAECDLETRKKTESQYQREMAAMEEAEEVLKRVSERSAVECSSLLRTLHSLEQEHLRRSLALQQEEDLAKAHRQLAIFQRNELHNIFFTQIKSAIFKGELKPEAAKMLLQDYSKIQESVEELMDFFQASKRYHLSKRFGHREYLVQNIQSSETRVQGLLSTASAQLTLLIQKHERAGYLDEDQMQVLLERAQTEVFSIKQKLDNDLKQEKKKLHQKLIIKRRREMLQKQILEEHSRDLAARAERLEGEERDRGQEGVQSVRQRLKDDALEASTEEQAELRHWEHLIFTKLCSSAFSLSEEELLGMRQEVHGCFAQMDRSLALPKIRARVLLQQFQTAWREAEFLKLDQAVAAPELQPQSKARKPRSKSRSKIDLLKKCIEDKIQLFEEQAPEDLVEKVRGELLRERVQQLEAQEGLFAESLVSLQFQKAARMARTLWAYTALLSIQDLLLEELSASETLTKSACMQILESHSPELQELERKLEDQLAHQEAAQLQRALDSWQQWAGEGPALLQEPEETDPESHISAVLQRALSKGQKLLEHHQQSLREEQEDSVVLEDLLENMETDTFVTLYGQELRLASYLSKLTMLPGGTLRRLLTVALPAASQAELLAVLDSVGQKHQDHSVENDGSRVQADLGRRGKHQGWWQALESKLRGELINRGLEKMLWAQKRKESILKKTCPPLRERVIFSGKGSWPHLSLESTDELTPVPIVGAEAVDLLNTGEKLFIFRNPKEPEISLHVPPRKKKKNFLNAKKAAWALGMN
ncbi:limbin isoform X4 [Bubalus bubalis]|uniref:limbin isoform X4 n=1 Tax=Bubalus bubalis TaxID=89462 RepID=UPI001E1B7814|nr:limbin isoform X4 [Bubalus bubalis]